MRLRGHILLVFLRYFLSLTIVSSLLLFYNNCGTGFQLDGNTYLSDEASLSWLEESWPEVNCLSEPRFKLAVEPESERRGVIASQLAQGEVTADKSLLITIHNECFYKFGSQSIFTKQLADLTPEASMTTFRWPVTRSLSSVEIQREVLGDTCIVEVDLDEEIKLFNTPPRDPRYSAQRYLASIRHASAFAGAYNEANGINTEIKVAVIDSGVDINHPDLRNVILREAGRVVGLNVINNTQDVSDSGFHGTHVAGIIAAQSNNNEGISGVAGSHVKIIPIRASNDGSSLAASAVTNGIRWAADQGADIINLSLGGGSRVQAWQEAIAYAISKGALVVTAAGNNGQELTLSNPTYPAMFNVDFEALISVGSYDVGTQTRSSFSNYSKQYVDIFAPGSDGSIGVLSTVPINLLSAGYASSSSSKPIQGTSMATPVVTGAAAMVIGLARSRGFQISPAQVKQFFNVGSKVTSGYQNLAIGSKVLDAQTLLEAVATDTGLPLGGYQDRSLAAGRVQIASHSPSLGIRQGDPLVLEVQKTQDSSILVNYQWFKDGQPLSQATGPRYQLAQTNLRDKGVYEARIISGRTVRATGPIKVNVENCN